MSESFRRSSEWDDSPNKDEIIKLKKLLKRVERIIKYRCKKRKRFNIFISKFMRKLNKLSHLKEVYNIEIENLKERKRIIRKEIRERHRVKYLERKRRLERLKLMCEFNESLRIIYLKELKTGKKRKKYSLRRNPQIKKIVAKLEKVFEKQVLVEEKMQKLQSKVEKFKKRKISMGILLLRRKAKKIRNQLYDLMNPQYEVEQKRTTIQYKETPETKIIEFQSVEKTTEYKPLPVRAVTQMQSRGKINESVPRGKINEPVPIGDKQSDRYSGNLSDSKKKIFRKRRTKTKIEEPLPIGDKRDVEEKADIKPKRRSFFRRSRRPFNSDSEQKTLTSDSDVDVDVGARVLQKKKLQKRRVSLNSNGSSTEPITSLKTTTTDNDSEFFHRNSMTHGFNPKNVFTADFFKRPVDRRTLETIILPDRRTATSLQPEDENSPNEFTARRTHPRIRLNKSVAKPPDVYDDKFFRNLVKVNKPSIREKIKLERKKTLQEQQKQKKQEERTNSEKKVRESTAVRSTLAKSRPTMMDTDPLEKLVTVGLKSNFVVTDFENQMAGIDDSILKIASRHKGLTGFFPIFTTTGKHSNESIFSTAAYHKSKTTKFVLGVGAGASAKTHKEPQTTTFGEPVNRESQQKKSVQISDRPFFDRKPRSTHYDSDEETVLTISDLWDYNEESTDSKPSEPDSKPKDPPPKPRDPSPKIEDTKKVKRNLKNFQPLKSNSESDDEEIKEHVLKIICSACGMTDMTLGAFCCPFKPKKQ